MLAAVAANGTALRFASNALRGCRKAWAWHPIGRASLGLLKCLVEVVLAAVRQNGLALQFAEHSLRCDSELLRLAAQRPGFCLCRIKQEFRNYSESFRGMHVSKCQVVVLRLELLIHRRHLGVISLYNLCFASIYGWMPRTALQGL